MQAGIFRREAERGAQGRSGFGPLELAGVGEAEIAVHPDVGGVERTRQPVGLGGLVEAFGGEQGVTKVAARRGAFRVEADGALCGLDCFRVAAEGGEDLGAQVVERGGARCESDGAIDRFERGRGVAGSLSRERLFEAVLDVDQLVVLYERA